MRLSVFEARNGYPPFRVARETMKSRTAILGVSKYFVNTDMSHPESFWQWEPS